MFVTRSIDEFILELDVLGLDILEMPVENVDVLIVAFLHLLHTLFGLFLLLTEFLTASFDSQEFLVTQFFDFPAFLHYLYKYLLFRVDFKQLLFVIVVHLDQPLLQFVHITDHFCCGFIILATRASSFLQFLYSPLQCHNLSLLCC